MTENMNLIASLVWLRRLGADEHNPQDSFRKGFVRAPGLVERCGDRAYLTPDGWDPTGEVDPTDTETHGSDGPGLGVGEEQVH